MKFERQTTKLGILILVSITFILLCGSFLFNQFAASSSEMVLHTLEIRASAERLMQNVVDAETGQRGFIITQNKEFLSFYDSSKNESLSQLSHLKRLVADNLIKGVCLNTLTRTIIKKFIELDETVALVKEQKQSEAIAIVSNERGKTLMDEIRKTILKLLIEEDRSLNTRAITANRDKLFTTILLLFGICTFAIFAISELRRYYVKNQYLVMSNEKLDSIVRDRTQSLELEKSKVVALLQDVTHRVGNNLAMISALLGVQIRKNDNQEVKTALSDARTRIAAIAAGQRQLQLDLETDEIRAKPYLENLLAETQQVAEERGISLKHVIDDLPLPGRDAVSYIVLANELTTNSLKHGFPDGLCGEITVKLRVKSEDHQPFIELSVEDDGMGQSSNGVKTGLGHSIIQSLLKSMNATLETSCIWPEKKRKGYKSVIKIPIVENN